MKDTSSTSGRRVLIASATLPMAQQQEIAWKRVFPGDTVSFVLASPAGAVRSDLPRDLPLSQVPMLSEPRWKVETRDDTKHSRWLEEAGWKPRIITRSELPSALKEFDLLVCGTGPERRAIFSFVNLLKHHGIPLTDDIPYWPAPRWEKTDFAATMNEMRPVTSRDLMDEARREECACYFRFNNRINAHPVLGVILQRIGAPQRYDYHEGVWKNRTFVSPFALRIFQYLAYSGIERIEEGDFLRTLRDWVGSGKYPHGGRMHPAARVLVLDEVLRAGLLEAAPGSSPLAKVPSPKGAAELEASREVLVVTEVGKKLMASLHRSMWDPDLPGRLTAWEDEWPASKPKIDRYLRTMWGRQKRAL
jgi:hypothetical protein